MTALQPGSVLARLEALPDPGARAGEGAARSVILVREGQAVTAWRNVCPHAQAPLSLPDGRVLLHQGETLVCPVHGASFDARSGQCTGGPAAGTALEPVDVEIVDGEVRLR